jgi:hypothetical protein
MKSSKVLAALILGALLTLPAAAVPLSAALKENGVSQADASRFQGSVRQAVSSYKGQVGKLAPGASLPAPICAVLDQTSGLTSKYKLRGDQTIDLLGGVMEQVNPKFAQATPSLEPLKELMAQYRVPGPALFDFMLPNLKKGLQHHMSSKNPPSQLGMAELGEAVSFANRYKVPTSQFLSALENFRTAMKAAGH